MPSSPSETSLPSAPIESVLVVGAGLAGLRTVQSLRQRGFPGTITVIGEEPLAPYDRPPLSKHLFEHDSPVFFADDLQADIQELASEFVSHMRAVSLSREARGWSVLAMPSQISDDTAGFQRRLTADAVVLAVGSAPIMIEQWRGVSRLYTWNDAQELRGLLAAPGRIVIVGAGWIGSELSALAAAEGHEVHVIEAFRTPLFRQLGATVGSRVASWFAQAGVQLHLESSVTGVHENLSLDSRDLERTDLSVEYLDADGLPQQLRAQVVVSSVGARPQTSWLAEVLPLAEHGAIPTDQQGRVENPAENDVIPGLFAVGDCAVRRDDIHGWVPGGHWNTALSDPERVAAAILNDSDPDSAAPATPTPHVFSTQFGKDLNLFGTPDVDSDRVVLREHANGSFSALYLRADADDAAADADQVAVNVASAHVGHAEELNQSASSEDDAESVALLTGIFTVDAPRDAAQARKLLANGPVLIDVDRALDPDVMLRNVRVQ